MPCPPLKQSGYPLCLLGFLARRWPAASVCLSSVLARPLPPAWRLSSTRCTPLARRRLMPAATIVPGLVVGEYAARESGARGFLALDGGAVLRSMVAIVRAGHFQPLPPACSRRGVVTIVRADAAAPALSSSQPFHPQRWCVWFACVAHPWSFRRVQLWPTCRLTHVSRPRRCFRLAAAARFSHLAGRPRGEHNISLARTAPACGSFHPRSPAITGASELPPPVAHLLLAAVWRARHLPLRRRRFRFAARRSSRTWPSGRAARASPIPARAALAPVSCGRPTLIIRPRRRFPLCRRRSSRNWLNGCVARSSPASRRAALAHVSTYPLSPPSPPPLICCRRSSRTWPRSELITTLSAYNPSSRVLLPSAPVRAAAPGLPPPVVLHLVERPRGALITYLGACGPGSRVPSCPRHPSLPPLLSAFAALARGPSHLILRHRRRFQLAAAGCLAFGHAARSSFASSAVAAVFDLRPLVVRIWPSGRAARSSPPRLPPPPLPTTGRVAGCRFRFAPAGRLALGRETGGALITYLGACSSRVVLLSSSVLATASDWPPPVSRVSPSGYVGQSSPFSARAALAPVSSNPRHSPSPPPPTLPPPVVSQLAERLRGAVITCLDTTATWALRLSTSPARGPRGARQALPWGLSDFVLCRTREPCGEHRDPLASQWHPCRHSLCAAWSRVR